MTAAFILLQDVDLSLELLVGVDGAGLAQNLSALDFGSLNTAQKSTDVVAALSVVEGLAEHLKAGNDCAALLIGQTDYLSGVVQVDLTTLDTAGNNGSTSGDGHRILDGHQEGLLIVTCRCRDVCINSIHKLMDASILRSIGIIAGGLEGGES